MSSNCKHDATQVCDGCLPDMFEEMGVVCGEVTDISYGRCAYGFCTSQGVARINGHVVCQKHVEAAQQDGDSEE